MADVKLLVKSEIGKVVSKAKALIQDHHAEAAAVYQALEELLCLLPNSDRKSSSTVLQSNSEQSRSIFVSEYYDYFGECFTENFNMKWLQSDCDSTAKRVILLFDEYFSAGPDEQAFILLCRAISVQQLHVVRIHCVQLLECLLKKRCIVRILEQYCSGEVQHFVHRCGLSDDDLARSPQCQTLLSAICSLPDVVSAQASLEAGMFFVPENYVPFIGCEILAVMRTVHARLQTDLDSSVLILSLLVGKISVCGYGELLVKNLVAELQPLCLTDFLWCRIVQQFIGRVPDRCLESVIVPLVVLVPSANALGRFIGTMPRERPKLAYILSHKLLLVRCFDGPVAAHVLRNIIGYIAQRTELSMLFTSAFRSVLATWADGSSLRHRPMEQNLYLSKAVVAFIMYALPQVVVESREQILRCLLDGLPNYLRSSDQTVRQIGSVVAEKLSDIVHKDDGVEPLRFNVENNEIVDSILDMCKIPICDFSANTDSQGQAVDKDSKVVTETFNNLSLHAAHSETTDKCPQVLDEETEELKPYAVFASEPENPKKPVYLAQCIDGLIKQDDHEAVEQSLIHVERLVRNGNVNTVREVGVELCRILLHLDDQFALVDFRLLRYRGMVALAVTIPALIAEYLGAEFYARNYNIRQRMDILDVLTGAAGELSEPPASSNFSSNSSTAAVPSSLVPATEGTLQPIHWSEVVSERVEAKTRRFAKGRQCPVPSAAVNRFAGVAGSFFYPLLRHFDRRSDPCLDLLGSDHLVFERLIYTLGSVMLAASGTPAAGRMAAALFEFLRCSRHHDEAGVRRANLYAVCAGLASMPSGSVLDDPTTFSELGDWLRSVLQHDVDAECCQRTCQALQLLTAAVQQVNA